VVGVGLSLPTALMPESVSISRFLGFDE